MISIVDIIELRRYGFEKRDMIFKEKMNLTDRDLEFIKNDVKIKFKEIEAILYSNLEYLKPDNGLFYKNKNEILIRYYKEIMHILVNRFEILTKSSCIFYLIDEGYLLERKLKNIFYQNGMFSLITTDYLDRLSFFLKGKKVLELCGGRGYLSKGLFDSGVNIKCTDDKSWHKREGWTNRNYIETENLDAIEALNKYVEDVDIVLVSWIPFSSKLDQLILKRIRESKRKPLFLVIGESYGGCTGSDAFHSQIKKVHEDISKKINEVKDNWDGIHDHVMICK